MSFFAWPEISNFHNLRRSIKVAPELLKDQDSKVTYRCKVKLHGTNAAVQVCADGSVKAQSRTNIIDSKNDNCGFAHWVESQEEEWTTLRKDGRDIIFFGEWCGLKIQKGAAISDIGKKIFAIFALIVRKGEEVESFITDPGGIWSLLKKRTYAPFPLKDVYVLEWYVDGDVNFVSPFESVIDWEASVEVLQPELTRINTVVDAVEKCDPWVKETFGVDGVGEGLVFYPALPYSTYADFANLAFKAKGEQHKVVNAKASVQADAETVNSAKEFANLVLTEARLKQGAQAVGENNPTYDMKLIGKFLEWIVKDVKKETIAELETSKLTWEQVNKAVLNQARQWYLTKNKTL